jgi:hypothetical protein
MKLPTTVIQTVIGVVIIKTVSFSLLRNMFRLLPINGHGTNNRSTEINFYLTNNETEKADMNSGDLITTLSPFHFIIYTYRNSLTYTLLT